MNNKPFAFIELCKKPGFIMVERASHLRMEFCLDTLKKPGFFHEGPNKQRLFICIIAMKNLLYPKNRPGDAGHSYRAVTRLPLAVN
jgi:hypothetical protein